MSQCRFKPGFGAWNRIPYVYLYFVVADTTLFVDKESWEPTLEKLMALQTKTSGNRAIREAWSFDAPSHGDSAILNAGTLNHRMDDVCGSLENALCSEGL